ncbi:MAG: bifunctional sulfate adenylyltransferase subunit 1/adenylylsulfate kinase [Acidobacteria bacterium]|nr:MAG: bifunctional sulfate adenylyltransferase subunit 1/adenylylsulfate kinase [Acidobacteriota bacterium]
MQSIEAFLKLNEKKELVRFSTAGSVDDGKSTLIGRLLHDSKCIYEDQLSSIKKASKNRDIPIDFALLTDGLKAEREQGITIDVAYRYFSTSKRKYIIADTPGHEQYTRNMATGASTADMAVILVDAVNGLLPQSKRHAFISTLLQIPHIIIAVNKMDLVDYRQAVFDDIVNEFTLFAEKLQIHDLRFIPISALHGDFVVDTKSDKMPWYQGPSLLELLETIHIRSDKNLIDLRFPVQLVSRPDRTFRGYSGQLSSGILRKGTEIMALPSMQKSRVKSIVTFDGELEEARPGQAITITLEDERDISRGDMLVHPDNRPLFSRRFEAMLVWMDEEALDPDQNNAFLLKTNARTVSVSLDQVRYVVNVNTLSKENANQLQLNEIGRIVFTSNELLFLDSYQRNRANGQFILISAQTHKTVAAGMIIHREKQDRLPVNISVQADELLSRRNIHSKISRDMRASKNRHRAFTLWFTGLLSSGKTDCAVELERHLFEKGYQVKLLSGGQVRKGLCRDLGFSSEDSAEHLRRVAETAKILNEAGIIVIASFISPVQKTRESIKKIIGKECFYEVHFNASVSWCEQHDQTGLYEAARKDPNLNLAGVTFPYEEPLKPDLTLNPEQNNNQSEWIKKLMTFFPPLDA